jgi:hypothetical protein
MAALALVGSASAWTEVETLAYQFTDTVDMQAGQNLDWLTSYSGAYADSANPYAQYAGVYMSVSNDIYSIYAPLQPVNDQAPDTHNTVTQYGASVFTANAPDLENPCGIQWAANSLVGQELALSGNYNDVTANMQSSAYWDIWDDDTDWMPRGYAYSSPAVTSIPYGDAFIEANLGQSIEVGLEQINAVGALPTMSGEQTVFAGFDGAYDADGDGDISVDTFVDGNANFYNYDWWV